MDNLFTMSDNDEIVSQALDILGAQNRAFVLVSSDLRIAAMTDPAKALLCMKTFEMLPECLSEETVKALRLCAKAGTGTTLQESIDEVEYSLAVRPVPQGLLLCFLRDDGPTADETLRELAALQEQIGRSADQETGAAMMALYRITEILTQRELLPQLENIRAAAMRIHRTVEHARALSAPLGTVIADLRTQDLSETCRQIMEAAQTSTPAGVTLRLEAPETCTAVYDRLMLMQAVFNLLTNAMRAPGARTVVLQLTHTAGNLSVSVQDDGEGLSPETLSHVYEGWRSARSTAQLLEDTAAGIQCSLGLPLVRRIAGLHDGVLLMRPNASRGTVFSFSFPDSLRPLKRLRQYEYTMEVESGIDLAEMELSVLHGGM